MPTQLSSPNGPAASFITQILLRASLGLYYFKFPVLTVAIPVALLALLAALVRAFLAR